MLAEPYMIYHIRIWLCFGSSLWIVSPKWQAIETTVYGGGQQIADSWKTCRFWGYNCKSSLWVGRDGPLNKLQTVKYWLRLIQIENLVGSVGPKIEATFTLTCYRWNTTPNVNKDFKVTLQDVKSSLLAVMGIGWADPGLSISIEYSDTMMGHLTAVSEIAARSIFRETETFGLWV